MASTIAAGTTSTTAIAISGDTSGNLAFTTQNGANTITVPNSTGTLLTTGSPQSGSIIQTINSTYTGDSTTTGSSFVSSGLYATITPKFSTSKILILATSSSTYVQSSSSGIYIKMYRGTSGAGSGSSIGANSYYFQPNTSSGYTMGVVNIVDSPSSTSALTYTVMMAVNGSGSAGFVSGFGSGNNLATIVLMVQLI